jgi:hypothetical protein
LTSLLGSTEPLFAALGFSLAKNFPHLLHNRLWAELEQREDFTAAFSSGAMRQFRTNMSYFVRQNAPKSAIFATSRSPTFTF